jgi:hypothetical protein
MALQMPRTTSCLRLLQYCRSFKGPFFIYDSGPRTAPLTNLRLGFLFDPKPTPIHTPERKREHAHFPSEGVFNLLMDEDSSFFSPSDASGELKAMADFPPPHRCIDKVVLFKKLREDLELIKAGAFDTSSMQLVRLVRQGT